MLEFILKINIRVIVVRLNNSKKYIYVGVESVGNWGERGDVETDAPISPLNLINSATNISPIYTNSIANLITPAAYITTVN